MSEHACEATSSNSNKDCNPMHLQSESCSQNNNLNEKTRNHFHRPSSSSTTKEEEEEDGNVAPNIATPSKVSNNRTPFTEEHKGTRRKKRKIHLDTTDCLMYNKSLTGVAPLTTPLAVVKGLRDPHQGLKPRYVKKRTQSRINEFVSSKQLYTGSTCSTAGSSGSKGRSPVKNETTPSPKRHPKCSPTQRNLISNYFSPENCRKETSKHDMEMPFSHSSPEGRESKPELSTQEMSAFVSRCRQRTPSKMYSPVKKVGGSSVYVMESCPDPVSDKIKASRNVFGNCSPEAKNQGSLTMSQTESTSVLHSDEDSDAFSSNEMYDSELLEVVDRYGLLGSGRYPSDPVNKTNWFEHLPAEVMENIFCFLPVQDLHLNANRVCRAWNQIISNPKVLHEFDCRE